METNNSKEEAVFSLWRSIKKSLGRLKGKNPLSSNKYINAAAVVLELLALAGVGMLLAFFALGYIFTILVMFFFPPVFWIIAMYSPSGCERLLLSLPKWWRCFVVWMLRNTLPMSRVEELSGVEGCEVPYWRDNFAAWRQKRYAKRCLRKAARCKNKTDMEALERRVSRYMQNHTGYNEAYELFVQLPFDSIRKKVALSGVKISDERFEWLLAQKDYATIEAYISYMGVNEQKANMLFAHYADDAKAMGRIIKTIADTGGNPPIEQLKQLLENKCYAVVESIFSKYTPSRRNIEELIAHYAEDAEAVGRIIKIIAEQYCLDSEIICQIYEKYPQLMSEISLILQEKADRRYLQEMSEINIHWEFLRREMSIPMQKILVDKGVVFAAEYLKEHDFAPAVIKYVVRTENIGVIQKMLRNKRGGQLLVDLLNSSNLSYLLR